MPEANSWLLGLLSLAVTWMLTWVVRQHALRAGVLDVPNLRSSHSVPTPRGGGLAIVLAICLGIIYLWSTAAIKGAAAVALVGCGGIVAVVGYLDDRFGLGAGLRFATHLLATGAAVVLLGPQAIAESMLPALPAAIALLLVIIGVCWWLNLFNFMDGIDGIAATESAFVAGSAAALWAWRGGSDGQLTLQVIVAGASLGFLLWNWAPARIFMGDVGSGFLGFVLGLLALSSSLERGPLSIWTWLILGSVFVGDATVTLLRRVARGERWYTAHRSHAYQRLSRRWRSHSRVTILLALLDFGAVLPLAVWSVVQPELAVQIACGTLLLTGGAAALAGAGHREPLDSRS